LGVYWSLNFTAVCSMKHGVATGWLMLSIWHKIIRSKPD
jgi:hypothetical protein